MFNKGYYLVAMRQLREAIQVKYKIVFMNQPPYSPDLASADIFLFPKQKTPMKGKRFFLTSSFVFYVTLKKIKTMNVCGRRSLVGSVLAYKT